MARGQLRIYLGAAPGVGKTFAMLNEGRRRHDRGTDVVVGFVETHHRPRTEEQLGDLEVLPRRTIEYRGASLDEMDLDGILARKPEVVLVDELAHTNVPGSKHVKRWEDIEDILDAGINVISTVNIQHLESVNDVVERITGVEQRETVPDAVVRAANGIELVDMTPDALRRRMAHGNIYQQDKIDAALGNYFRVGNLTALRELALLWIADQVDTAMQDYRQRHGIERPWETRERVAVTLTGAPGGDDLIRRAARIAARSKAELIGIHVRPADGLAEPPGSALDEHKRLLTDLGGSYREVVDSNIAVALVNTAIAENSTQLIIGASRRSRWTRLTSGSIIGRVITAADGSLDVHVIAPKTDEPPTAGPPPHRRGIPLSRLSRQRQLAGFALALVGLPLLTVALSPIRDRLGFASIALIFLLVVVIVGAVGGAWVAAFAAVTGFLLLNWFFADPIHTFTITNERDATALAVFLLVAAVVSGLVERAARRSADAARARSEAQALASMAGALLREDDPVPDLVGNLVTTFGLDGAAVLEDSDDRPTSIIAVAGANPPTTTADADLVISLSDRVHLALNGSQLGHTTRAVINAFADQLSVALVSRRLRSEAAHAAALGKANDLRSTLLAAVSHDLRTPLAAIKTSTSTLLDRDVPLPPDASRQLLETIDTEADRLNDLVGNLLDLGRIEADALGVRRRPTSLADVVDEAVAITDPRSVVKIDLPADLPPIDVDPGILERAIGNLLENADRYTPDGGIVYIHGGLVDDRVEVRIIDQGPGIPPMFRDRILRPFERLEQAPESAGVGLGLAVASGFIAALDGDLSIEDTPGGGTTMVIALPVWITADETADEPKTSGDVDATRATAGH
jgi:two-component system sensor histidine kinase KdpD